MNKELNLLGLAMKAGKIVSGTDIVLSSLKNHKAKMVYVASDSSASTIDQLNTKCYYYQVTLNTSYTFAELSNAIGKPRKVIAVIDQGFVTALKKSKEVN